MNPHTPRHTMTGVADKVNARRSQSSSSRQTYAVAEENLPDIDSLRISEVRYRRLFEAARDGILLLDLETGRITDANPFMVELLGYSHEELLGKELWEIGLFSDKASSQTAFDALQRDGYIRYEDLPLESKYGQNRDVEFVSNVYREGDADVIQCNIRDITDRKQSERDLASHQAELTVLNERLRSAMTEAHHRVKNNLQVVVGMLDMAVMDEPEQIRSAAVKRISVSVRAMAVVHDILTQSSRENADANEIPARRVFLSLIDLLQQSTATARIYAEVEECTLTARQTTSLALVLTELIYNAIKHGAREVRVGFDGKMLSVCDDGPGFPDGFDAVRDSNTGLELVLELNRWDLGGHEIRLWNRPQGGAGVEVMIDTHRA